MAFALHIAPKDLEYGSAERFEIALIQIDLPGQSGPVSDVAVLSLFTHNRILEGKRRQLHAVLGEKRRPDTPHILCGVEGKASVREHAGDLFGKQPLGLPNSGEVTLSPHGEVMVVAYDGVLAHPTAESESVNHRDEGSVVTGPSVLKVVQVMIMSVHDAREVRRGDDGRDEGGLCCLGGPEDGAALWGVEPFVAVA
eukprot:CAMPEP_0175804530 /NCGR_PEP_ID=MMETSP0107_2-20121207/166_1 /TAXON_ID=195067 ORGANISM="Goniomonas pacifica, Strain CCMP1869" /NCGR_SAMPLE_ID=MMETSP0107_2 /ASSEMBLY_ACC=CAM_ASM_000203 /LENGTH=196 /DNA_ID=CAMNT_0017115879 /DNA_START=44 /DNA_END=631 /DNA_ORIENTATION=+